MRLLPKDKIFFELFEAHAQKAVEIARLLQELVEDYARLPEIAKKAKIIEDEADRIVHRIAIHRDSSFITPIEREDIAMLAYHVDDVVDCVERAINRMSIFEVRISQELISAFSRIINTSADEIKEGIECLRNLKRKERKLIGHCIRLNDLEAEADELHRQWLAENMTDAVNDAKSILEKVLMKEVIGTLEEATDRCEDVANTLETIRTRNL